MSCNNASAKFYKVYSGDTAAAHDLRISHLGYDRAHSTAEDMASWFPLAALHEAAKDRLIGNKNRAKHGLSANWPPTGYMGPGIQRAHEHKVESRSTFQVKLACTGFGVGKSSTTSFDCLSTCECL